MLYKFCFILILCDVLIFSRVMELPPLCFIKNDNNNFALDSNWKRNGYHGRGKTESRKKPTLGFSECT